MRYKIFMSVIAGCLIVSYDARAQKKVYSLSEIWQKAVEQYPSLPSKKYGAERQQLRKELVNKELLPEVNIQSQYSYGSYQGVPGVFFLSVVQSQSGVFVIKTENNITKRIPVQPGVAKDSLVEILGNLQAGDIILQKGSEEIKEGIKINKK